MTRVGQRNESNISQTLIGVLEVVTASGEQGGGLEVCAMPRITFHGLCGLLFCIKLAPDDRDSNPKPFLKEKDCTMRMG